MEKERRIQKKKEGMFMTKSGKSNKLNDALKQSFKRKMEKNPSKKT